MALTLLAQIAGDGVSSTIDFTSIPQNYKSLKLTGAAECSGNQNTMIYINGTTYTDYSDSGYGGSSYGGFDTLNVPFKSVSTTLTSGAWGYGEVNFPNYSQSSSQRNIYSRAYANPFTQFRHGNFATTSTITSIQITTSTSFTTNALFMLWGID